MIKPVAMVLAAALLTIAAPLCAQTTDLSSPGVFEQLRASNPEHYDKIRQIVAGLAERPSRIESGWLAETFGATNVAVTRPSLLLSDLAEQSVQFTLDRSRYRLEVIRTDLNVGIELPRQTLVR